MSRGSLRARRRRKDGGLFYVRRWKPLVAINRFSQVEPWGGLFLKSDFIGFQTSPTCEGLSQVLIPAKPRGTGREPGSRTFCNELFSWIPDLVMQGITRPVEDPVAFCGE